MSVKIGKVEIKATTRLEAGEARRRALASAPGHSGAVAQDLGTEPVIIHVEGKIFGEEATGDLETLRSAWAAAEPQSLAADIVSGSQVTDVIIEDLQVHQAAGTKDTYLVAIRLREWTEPPEKAGFGIGAVASGIMADAGKWMKVAGSVMKVIQDPSCLADELMKNADLLDELGVDDLANAFLDNIENLLPGDLAAGLKAIRKLDPKKAFEVAKKIATAKNFDDFCKKGGLKDFEELGKSMGVEIPPELKKAAGAVGAAVAIMQDPDMVGDIKKLVESAQRLGKLLSKPEALLPGGAG